MSEREEAAGRTRGERLSDWYFGGGMLGEPDAVRTVSIIAIGVVSQAILLAFVGVRENSLLLLFMGMQEGLTGDDSLAYLATMIQSFCGAVVIGLFVLLLWRLGQTALRALRR